MYGMMLMPSIGRILRPGADRFQREEVALRWSNMGNLASVTAFKCIHPLTGTEHSYDPIGCFVLALEVAPTFGRAWRNLSIELEKVDSSEPSTVVVAGTRYTAITAIVEAVRQDPCNFANWLTLGEGITGEKVEVWPGKFFTRAACYIYGLEIDVASAQCGEWVIGDRGAVCHESNLDAHSAQSRCFTSTGKLDRCEFATGGDVSGLLWNDEPVVFHPCGGHQKWSVLPESGALGARGVVSAVSNLCRGGLRCI